MTLPLVDVAAESGAPPLPFNLESAAYHTSETTGVLHECPYGLDDMCSVSHEDSLEAQLAPFETIIEHALEQAG